VYCTHVDTCVCVTDVPLVFTVLALQVEAAQFVDRLSGMLLKYIVHDKNVVSGNSQFVQ